MQSLHISIPYICSLLSSFSYQMLTWKTTEDIYYIKPLKNKTKTKWNQNPTNKNNSKEPMVSERIIKFNFKIILTLEDIGYLKGKLRRTIIIIFFKCIKFKKWLTSHLNYISL